MRERLEALVAALNAGIGSYSHYNPFNLGRDDAISMVVARLQSILNEPEWMPIDAWVPTAYEKVMVNDPEMGQVEAFWHPGSVASPDQPEAWLTNSFTDFSGRPSMIQLSPTHAKPLPEPPKDVEG